MVPDLKEEAFYFKIKVQNLFFGILCLRGQ